MPVATTSKPVTRKVPKRALSFAAEATIGSNGEGAKTAPITILARTGKPIDHWYWGKIVHDMSGMKPNKDRITLDYCHDPGDVIGFGNKFDVSSGDLVISGALTPYKEQDRANEIMHKGALGVPYEGSIFFGEDAKLEQLMEGVSTKVNGLDIEGPAIIVREWTLRGCAVCPYGADGDTEVTQLSAEKGQEKEITVHVFEAEAPADGQQPPVESTDEKPASDPRAVETETPSDESTEGEVPPVEVEKPAGQEGEDGAVIPNAQSVDPRAECKKFMDAFGTEGANWFAEGLTFEQGRDKHIVALNAKVAALETKNQELTASLAVTRGETTPVSFSSEGSPAEVAATDGALKLGAKRARLAAAVAASTKK